jgi:uncharacterized membrane protein
MSNQDHPPKTQIEIELEQALAKKATLEAERAAEQSKAALHIAELEKVGADTDEIQRLKQEAGLGEPEQQVPTPEVVLRAPDARLEDARQTYIKNLLAYEKEQGKIYKIRQKLGLYSKKGLEATQREREEKLRESKAPYDQARKEMGQHLFAERMEDLHAQGLSGEELKNALTEYKATVILARTIIEERQKIIDAKVAGADIDPKLWKKTFAGYMNIQPRWKKVALGTALVMIAPAVAVFASGGVTVATVGTLAGVASFKFGRSMLTGAVSAGITGLINRKFVDKKFAVKEEKQKDDYERLMSRYAKGEISDQEVQAGIDTIETENKILKRNALLAKVSTGIFVGLAVGGATAVGLHAKGLDSLGEVSHTPKPSFNPHSLPKTEVVSKTIDEKAIQDIPELEPKINFKTPTLNETITSGTHPAASPDHLSSHIPTPHKQLDLEELNKITRVHRTIDTKAIEETPDIRPDGTVISYTPDGAVPPVETGVGDDVVPLPLQSAHPIVTPNIDLNVPGAPAENHLFVNPQSGIGYGNNNGFTTPVGMTPNEHMETLQSAGAVHAEAARELRIIGPNQEVTAGSMQDQLIHGVKPKNLIDTDPTHFKTTHDIERAWGKGAILDKPHGTIHGVKYETWSDIVDTHIRQNNIFFKSPADYQEQKWLQNLFGDSPKKAWLMDNATGKKVSVDTMNWWTTKPNWHDIDRMPARYFMNFNKESINDLVKSNNIGMTDLKKMIDFGIVKNVGSASRPVFEFTSNHEFERLVKAFKHIDPQHGIPGTNETMAQYMHRMSTQMAEARDGTIFRIHDGKAPGAWHRGAPSVRGANDTINRGSYMEQGARAPAYGRYVEQRTSGVVNQMSGRRGGFTEGTFFTNTPDAENILGRFAPGIPHDPSRIAAQAVNIFIQKAVSGIGGGSYRTY